MKTIEAPPMMSTRVAEEVRAAILDGSLAPGSRVRQEELAAKLGVSREPIRRALAMLEKEGLVNSVERKGAIVAPVDPHMISDIYEFRELVEGYSAAKAAASEDFDTSRLRKVVAQGRKAVRAGDLNALIGLDLEFHTGLYLASGNRVVAEVMRTQWSHIRRAMMMTLKGRGYRSRAWDEHAAILQAIEEKNQSRAHDLAAAHARDARTYVLAGLGSEASEESDAE